MIVAISNKYKNTLDDLIDSLETESLEVPSSESAPIDARPDLEGDYLNKDGRGLKSKEGCWGDKKRQVVRENSSPKISIYYQ